VLGRMFRRDRVRGFGQDRVEDARPVRRGSGVERLTDQWHPTQMLATCSPCASTPPGRCEASRTATSATPGTTPHARCSDRRDARYGRSHRGAAELVAPTTSFGATAEKIAGDSGAHLMVTDNLTAAVDGVDFLYTDVWVSMGEPTETWNERIKLLLPYQVNDDVLALTGNPDVKFMHCLPALHNHDTASVRRSTARPGLSGLEVTDECSSRTTRSCSTRPRTACTRSRPSVATLAH